LKGGNSRWQRKERKQRRKNQRRKRGIKAQRLITILNAFGITTPNFNPGGEFNFPPGFFVPTTSRDSDLARMDFQPSQWEIIWQREPNPISGLS
jgi:hypothetical protein